MIPDGCTAKEWGSRVSINFFFLNSQIFSRKSSTVSRRGKFNSGSKYVGNSAICHGERAMRERTLIIDRRTGEKERYNKK